jgi:hypothetical protein
MILRNKASLTHFEPFLGSTFCIEFDAEKDRIKLSKVEKFYQAIKSIHVHLNVSELTIYTSGREMVNL